MARHLALSEHLSTDEIYAHYRAATDAVERPHWQVIWLKSQHWTTPEIAAATGYSPGWVRTLVHRYNEQAADGLRDRRHAHPGAAPLLDARAQAELERLLEHETAPEGGKWNGPKVARWIEQWTGRRHVHDQRGWDYLVRLGLPGAAGTTWCGWDYLVRLGLPGAAGLLSTGPATKARRSRRSRTSGF